MSSEYRAAICVGLPEEVVETLPNFDKLDGDLERFEGGGYPVWGIRVLMTENYEEFDVDDLPIYAVTDQFKELTGLEPKLFLIVDYI